MFMRLNILSSIVVGTPEASLVWEAKKDASCSQLTTTSDLPNALMMMFFFFNSHYARWAYGLCRASRAYALDDVSFASFALNKYVNQFHLIHTIHIFFQNDSTFSESHGLTPTYLLRQNACLLVSPGNPGIQNVV